jgi:hypothetical protein
MEHSVGAEALQGDDVRVTVVAETEARYASDAGVSLRRSQPTAARSASSGSG